MRLLICDDHALFVDALSMALTDNGYTVVATALDPDAGVAAAREHRPDVCLLDMTFPHSNGLNAISRIHDVSPDTKVVMLSGQVSGRLVADALARGARGFVCKTKPVGVIIEALELTRLGQLAVDPLVLRDAFRPHVDSKDPLHVLRLLTEREWEVLRCMMDGLNTAEMAEHLGVRPSTARAHVHSLFTKLGVHSRLKAVALMNAHASVDTWPDDMR
jgi:two-component system nitrate/nitrite response regulator NarL